MPTLTSLSIAGAGPVAQALGRRLVQAGHLVVAVASRTSEGAAAAAAFIGGGARPCSYEALAALDLPIIVAVTDTAITEVAARMASALVAPLGPSGPGPRQTAQVPVAVHTCGASGAGALAPLALAGWRCGMCHPLQTFANAEQGVEAITGATFGVAGDASACAWAEELVRSIGGSPLLLREDVLPLYHAAAVLAGNGAFALMEAALLLLEQAGVPREAGRPALAPLARRSVDNALASDADLRLTGPVARGDIGTIERHVEALAAAPAGAAEAYRTLGELLVNIAARRGSPPETARAMRTALRAGRSADGNR